MRRTLATAIATFGLLLTAATSVIALEPAASPGTGGDPRSPGQGPGLVGDPLFAIGAVVLIALTSVVVTLAYVRLTSSRSSDREG